MSLSFVKPAAVKAANSPHNRVSPAPPGRRPLRRYLLAGKKSRTRQVNSRCTSPAAWRMNFLNVWSKMPIVVGDGLFAELWSRFAAVGRVVHHDPNSSSPGGSLHSSRARSTASTTTKETESQGKWVVMHHHLLDLPPVLPASLPPSDAAGERCNRTRLLPICYHKTNEWIS